jgi:hypothetical protein
MAIAFLSYVASLLRLYVHTIILFDRGLCHSHSCRDEDFRVNFGPRYALFLP